MEHENLGVDANGEATSGLNHEGESTEAEPRGGTTRSSDEASERRGSEGLCQEDAKASCCARDEGRPLEVAL